jgi:hypothetical protein
MRIGSLVLTIVMFGAAGASFVKDSGASPLAAEEPQDEETSACTMSEGEEEELAAECDCWGEYACTMFASQKWLYDMTPSVSDSEDSACGLMSRDQARAACESACSGACEDQGVTCAE